MMNKTKFKKIIDGICKENVDLTDNGVNSPAAINMYYPKITDEEIDKKLRKGRDRLKNSHEEFEACIKSLRNYKCKSTTSINSYELKHQIERESGINISNGILIAAAIYLGLKIKQSRNKSCPNVSIALPAKPLVGAA